MNITNEDISDWIQSEEQTARENWQRYHDALEHTSRSESNQIGLDELAKKVEIIYNIRTVLEKSL